MRYEDVPSAETFGKAINEIYSDGCEIGYRYYHLHHIPVRCPFGYGLSYTSFEKSEWTKTADGYVQTITNTGSRAGGEVAQLFIDGELRAFKKVYLQPGESVAVTLMPEPQDQTEYSDKLVVPPEKPRFPVTTESPITDLNQTFIGRILLKYILSVAKKQAKAAEKLPECPEKDNCRKAAFFLRKTLLSNSLRTLSMTAQSALPFNRAQGMVELTNGHILKGALYFLRKIKVPKLPKEES